MNFLQRLEPLDVWLLALRVVALLTVAGWWFAHPLADLFWLFGGFAAYTIVLYVVGALRPASLAHVYRVAMVLDLVFVFFLVRSTGGMQSSFYLAFYLLIALHAFYFGLATGMTIAVLSVLLYAFVDGWPPPIHPADVAIRLGFFLLVATCMGGLAERERHEREVVKRLNDELETQQQHLREAQEQLIRSDRLATVGELAAGLAHDLRNPLAGIGGALHVLASQLPPRDGRQALLAEIQDQIARMNKTLTDLLRQARPSAPQYVRLNVNEVVEQSLWFLPARGSGGIETLKHLAADLPPLRLDPHLLQQALLNILVNARQAMPQGGRLTVTTALRRNLIGEEQFVEICVADTGPGIHEADQQRIFQPFFTTKAQGTGLGLAIAARIVEQHGGRIVVESAPGKGAAFRITLPVPQETRCEDHVIAASRR